MALTTERIFEILKETNGLSDHRYISFDIESNELFFVHGKLETARKSVSRDVMITVYVDHDGKRGNSTFKVSAATTEEELKDKLSLAKENALCVFDEPYVLPDNETCNVIIDSNISELSPIEAAQEVAEQVYGACKYDDCDVNALEVFVVKRTQRVLNSRGIDKTQTKYSVEIEAIPTCNGKDGESVELFEAYSLAELDRDFIKNEISARLDDVRARLAAKKPTEPLDCPVIMNATELKELFQNITSDVNYAAIYLHANLHSVGDALQTDPKGDRLNISMRASVKGSPSCARFDADGFDLIDREIVSEGRYVAGFGAHRFARYLGKTPTGALPCIDVACGAATTEQLTSTPHLELIYLSGLQVDLLADYIGGEIRLAYYFDGEKRVPVTGVAMSGKLSDVLNTAVLSCERVTMGNYCGPAKIKFDGLKIF